MSSLWMETSNASDNFILNVPSPMCNSLLHKSIFLPCIEETYLLISCKVNRKRSCRGSMTVEAAVVVPLLILFVLHLGSCLEMLRLHGRLEYALWQTGKELAIYGAAEARGHNSGGAPGDVGTALPDLAVSYLYVNGRLEQILGKDYLDSSPLAHGHQGLNYLASEYLEEDQCIKIVLTYQVCPQITCFPFPYFRMASRYYGRAWTGYALGEGLEQITYVYVTENGEVWHSRADCSYLKLNVSEAQTETVWMLRNEDGERYRSCSRCEDRPLGNTVYLTQDGNRYHTVRSCPALIRRIHAVVWQENIPYRPCSRCNVPTKEAPIKSDLP